MKQKASQARTGMRKAEKRMKDIAGIQSAVAVCQEQKPVHDKYLKIGWKKRQAAFAENHQEELKAYNKAYRYLKAQHIDLNVNLDALEAEYSKLQADHVAFARQLKQIGSELALFPVGSYGAKQMEKDFLRQIFRRLRTIGMAGAISQNCRIISFD